MSPTRVALLVGCSRYDDQRFPPLDSPHRDVSGLKRVLGDPKVGDFSVEPPLLDESSMEVRGRIEKFFANRKPDDLLLLYFSCHGDLDPEGLLYFVAKNTEKEWPGSTGIPARWVKEQMDKSRSQRIVLLLDCCYSGAFTKGRKGEGSDAEKILDKQLGGRGRVVITASGSMEPAHESEFTDAVVRGLETGEADLDDDGYVSAYELYQYVLRQVRHNKLSQTPTMFGDKMVGELQLAKNPHESLPLPDALERVLTSEIAWERLWAVDGLKLLLAGDHPGGQKRAARRALTRLSEKDQDPGVRKTAEQAMLRPGRPPDVPDPPSQRARRLAGVGLGVALGVLLGVLPYGKIISPQENPIACSSRASNGVLSLGTLLPKTGQFVYSGPAQDAGVRLAISDINDAGGIPRMPVTLDDANQRDEGNPSDSSADTVNQSTDALLGGEVDAIIGPATSPVALKVIDKIVCAGVIMFAPSNTSPQFTTYPDRGLYFRTAPPSYLEGAVLGELVVDDRNSTAVVMSRNDAFGNPLREATEKAIRESGGQVLDSFSYDPNAREYDKEIQRVKDKNPDAIVLIGFRENAQILAKMNEEGVGPRNKMVYVGSASMTSTLVAQVSPRDPGVLAGMKGTPLDTGGEAFVKRLREANPGLQDLVYAPQAYDAVVITALAAAVAGTDEPVTIAKEINGVTQVGEKCTSFAACMALVKDRKDIDYDGPSGPLEFTDPGEPRSATYVISEIQADGTIKPLRSKMVGPLS